MPIGSASPSPIAFIKIGIKIRNSILFIENIILRGNITRNANVFCKKIHFNVLGRSSGLSNDINAVLRGFTRLLIGLINRKYADKFVIIPTP
jgi:hypothetical protein